MKSYKILFAFKMIIPIIIAVLSITVFSNIATSQSTYAHTIEVLDQKRTNVLELTAAATGTSVAITAIPGDTATPIAEKLADVSGYFLIVLCAIYLEKYLLIVSGYITFTFIVPIACALFILNCFLHKPSWSSMIKKLVTFGIAIVLVVPVSVHITDKIEAAYGTSIQATIETAKELTTEETTDTEGIAGNDETLTTEEDASTNAGVTEDHGAINATDAEGTGKSTEKSGFFASTWQKVKDVLNNTTESVQNMASETTHSLTDGITDSVTIAKTVLNNFIEAVALMIVTTCIIPLLILLFFIWMVQIIVGADFNVPGIRPPFKLHHKHGEDVE